MDALPANFALPKIVHARCKAGDQIGAYVDREYVFEYCEAGHVDFRLETQRYRLNPGSALLMPPHMPHAMLDVRDDSHRRVIVHFTLPSASTLLQEYPLAVHFTGADFKRVTDQLHRLVDEWLARRPGGAMVISGMMTEILGLYWRCRDSSVPVAAIASKAWRNVEKVIPWMHQHSSTALSISDMSRRAGLSPAYFCKAFKEYTGRSPHNYLNGVRVEKARQLLCDAELNCSEVAERVGFPTVAAFSRIFRRTVGISPSIWAKSYLPSAREPDRVPRQRTPN